MCEFCTQHGEGKKWYLAMENYSRDLLDQEERRKYAAEFLNGFLNRVPPSIKQLDKIRKTPLMNLARPILIHNQKQDHYGQVVPMEDVEEIFKIVEGAVRLPCVCRRVTTGNMNARYCYGLTLDKQLFDALDDSFSLEFLSKKEALESIRKLDREGLVHSVWTFKTPFIGGLCNCDQDCMAYRITHARRDYPVMFRAEWVANVSAGECNGCRLCMRQCQYGAIRYSSNNKKVVIDPTACYGCGVCRAVCREKAITLSPRESVQEAAGMW
ncbi:MAG: 4Fe-4S dicluster domain-containing protein [Chloroflexi bacterium]|nr:4Fe-4S dicluster domain-containing protein [Chloroflexota bacterium]